MFSSWPPFFSVACKRTAVGLAIRKRHRPPKTARIGVVADNGEQHGGGEHRHPATFKYLDHGRAPSVMTEWQADGRDLPDTAPGAKSPATLGARKARAT